MFKVSKAKFAALSKTVESITKRVESNNIKTITMGFPDIYGRLIGKKYDPDYFLGGIINKGSNACNYLLGCDMMFTPLPNAKLSSFDLGYGDYLMKADLPSTRDINYVNGQQQLLFFSDLYYIEEDSKPVEYAPRYLLKKALKGLDEFGIKLKLECEINFTAFYEKYRKAMNDIKSMQPITEHNNLANVFYSTSNEKLLSSLCSSMLHSDIPVSSIFGDSGEGQFKIILDATDPVEFSDNITLMKLITKKLGDDNNMSFTYMAKFHKNTPGNGLNLKLVFTDKDGKALSNEKIDQISAGILNHTLDFPVFYGPNVNSYKRWFEDEIKESWNKIGNNSNIQGVNVIEEDKLKKIHFVLPGADSNPYLVLFAAIESAKEGLKEKITSKKAESNLEGKRLPINLNQANKLFNDSKFAKQILGNDYHYHYNAFYTFEYREYLNQVSLWESKRYLYSV